MTVAVNILHFFEAVWVMKDTFDQIIDWWSINYGTITFFHMLSSWENNISHGRTAYSC